MAIKGKTQGLDQMREGACGQACAADVTGVPVYFRGHQNNVAFYGPAVSILYRVIQFYNMVQ